MTKQTDQPNVAASKLIPVVRSKNKIPNSYSDRFSRMYSKIPKAVLAAIVYRNTFFASCAEMVVDPLIQNSHVINHVMWQWQILYDAGVVPQRPPKAGALVVKQFGADHGTELH